MKRPKKKRSSPRRKAGRLCAGSWPTSGLTACLWRPACLWRRPAWRPQLYIPLLCGDAIDRMLGPGQVDRSGVWGIILQILAVMVLAALAQWVLSVCNNKITFSVTRDLRNDAIHKIQSLPLSYLDSHPAGDIVSRMVADVDTFADAC